MQMLKKLCDFLYSNSFHLSMEVYLVFWWKLNHVLPSSPYFAMGNRVRSVKPERGMGHKKSVLERKEYSCRVFKHYMRF